MWQWSGPGANGGGAYRSAVVEAFRGPSPWGDSFRVVHGCHERRATVWCPSTFAAKDGAEQGFGIDYQLVSNSVRGKVVDAAVVKPPTWGQRFSDHALTIGRYDISEILADY